jgi:catechol 1,2-dioxygenase
MHGQVIDFETKKPLVGADVEVWQASTNGLYEQQDPEQVEFNLRGKFKTDAEGRYNFYCLRPTPYPVPDDGENTLLPPGDIGWRLILILVLYRPRWQAAEPYGSPPLPPCSHSHHCQFSPLYLERCPQANISAQATKEGYRPLTTQIFDREDKYLDNDSVFAVKDSLVVDFVPRKDDPKAALELEYDVKLVADTKVDGA